MVQFASYSRGRLIFPRINGPTVIVNLPVPLLVWDTDKQLWLGGSKDRTQPDCLQDLAMNKQNLFLITFLMNFSVCTIASSRTSTNPQFLLESFRF